MSTAADIIGMQDIETCDFIVLFRNAAVCLRREKVRAGLKELLETAGPRYIIPGLTMGGPETTYPGLYEAVSEVVGEFDEVYCPLK